MAVAGTQSVRSRVSKLPDVGTTIFTVISRRAEELGAVNLGQGFPDYPIDPRLIELVTAAMRAGFNQYAPMAGVPALQEQIAADVQRRHGIAWMRSSRGHHHAGRHRGHLLGHPALVGQGDEVIVFDPAYDSYDPAVRAGRRALRARAAAAADVPLSTGIVSAPRSRRARAWSSSTVRTIPPAR